MLTSKPTRNGPVNSSSEIKPRTYQVPPSPEETFLKILSFISLNKKEKTLLFFLDHKSQKREQNTSFKGELEFILPLPCFDVGQSKGIPQ